MDDVRELMTWDDLGLGSRELAQSIYDDGYRPDMVLAIARGGLLVAAALGYALGVKNTFTMNVEFYTGVDYRLEVPLILPPVPDFVDFQATRVLIADDVADTGRDARPRQGVLRGQGRGGPLRRPLREAAQHGQVRLRLEPHRPVDQLPVERQGPGQPGAGSRGVARRDSRKKKGANGGNLASPVKRTTRLRRVVMRVARAGLEPATPRFSAECSTS